MSEHDTPDTPDNGDHDPLVARLRRGLGALTDGVGDAPPELGLVTATPVPSAGGRRRWVTAGAAAAAVALVATGAVIVATGDGEEREPEIANLDPYTQVASTMSANVTSPEVADDQLYRAVATVLDDGRDGPQLCLGAIAESYPPQCGGLDITNWEWASALTFERASGVRWGEFVAVGTYDSEAQTFTLTQPARDAQPGDHTQGPDVDFKTPCDEPAGGWPAATDQQLSDAAQRIQAEPAGDASDTAPSGRGGAIEGFGGLWIGHNPNVLNVRIVGDLTAADAFIREFYDGPLCLIPSERTLAELQQIQDEIDLGSNPVMSGSYPDVESGRVVLEAIAPDAELEQQMAERYGDAVVVQVTGLTPIDDGEDPDPGPGTTPGTAGPAGPSTGTTGDDPGTLEPTTYRTFGFVLEDDNHGPQLCFGSEDSYPPQCSGIDLMNWNWEDVDYDGGPDAAEPTSARWGDYMVVGTYDRDANQFTLTEKPRTLRNGDLPNEPEPDFSSPCDAPEGGWPPATQEDLARAADEIQGRAIVEGFGGIWLGRNPFVLNVAVTGDVDVADTAIRRVYDGPLCVVPVRYTEAELIEISVDVARSSPDLVLGTGVDVERNVVEVWLLVDDAQLEADLAAEHGDTIEVVGAQLRPVGGGATPGVEPTTPSSTSSDRTVPPVDYPVPVDPDTPVTSPALD